MANTAAVALVGVAAVDLAVNRQLTVVFDVAFVLTCAASALAVRPQDFFVTAVMPPLLMLATVLMLALIARGLVANAGDGLLQAVVSGLAGRSRALAAGYALTLGLLGLRQVALRNQGALRRPHRPVPRQRVKSRRSGGRVTSARPR